MVDFEQADNPLVPDDDGVVTISTSTRLGSGSSYNIVIIHTLLCSSRPLSDPLSSDDELTVSFVITRATPLHARSQAHAESFKILETTSP